MYVVSCRKSYPQHYFLAIDKYTMIATSRSLWRLRMCWTTDPSLLYTYQSIHPSNLQISHCMLTPRAYSTAPPVRGPGSTAARAKATSSTSGNPLILLAGFIAIGAGGLYFFQKLAYSRGTVLQPGQEKKSKEYRQY